MARTCETCGKPLTFMSIRDGRFCPECYEAHLDRYRKRPRSVDEAEAAAHAEALSHIILTTETAHNLPVTDRLGIVTAEYVIGMHIFRDVASLFRDVFGGRSQTMQKGLKEARTAALNEMRSEAHALGADAVVGIDLDYSEISGGGKSMLFLVASGTAVRLDRYDQNRVTHADPIS